MKNLWSIYLKPDTLVEGTEVSDMLQRFPQAANQDGVNYIFVATHPEAVNPILVSEMLDSNGEQLSGEELVQALAIVLFSTDRSRAIHLSKAEVRALGRHPAWKLWCGRYEDKAVLEADHVAVFGVGVDRRKAMDTLVEESRATLKQVFAGG